MKVVVLTGPESAGKSSLALHLQQRYGGLRVDEQVRPYIEEIGRDTCYADVELIARRQLEHEDQARAQRPDLLILDTHLLSNRLWSQILFGQEPDWLQSALLERHYDLHLLLDPRGVPWVADGQRCQPDLPERLDFHRRCQHWLDTHQQPYAALGGDWQARWQAAEQSIERLL